MIKHIIEGKNPNPNKLPILTKHKDKKRFEQFIPNNRNALLVLPRYDHSLSRSVVDIVDLNNFEVIYTYKHDIAEMNDQITNTEEFPKLKIVFEHVSSKYGADFVFQNKLNSSLGYWYRHYYNLE